MDGFDLAYHGDLEPVYTRLKLGYTRSRFCLQKVKILFIQDIELVYTRFRTCLYKI